MRLALLAALALCGCSSLPFGNSLSHGFDGLVSPQGVEDRAKLHADYAALKAKLAILAPDLLRDAEAIAADVTAQNYAGAIVAIVAAIPRVAEAAPAVLDDIHAIVADIRHLIDDVKLADQADAEIAKAKARVSAKKSDGK